MRTRPVHWSEGMLILPHHFQAAHAQLVDLVASSDDLVHPYNYGLRFIDINYDALSNFEVRIPRLRARLKDGTVLSVPDNANLSTLDLKPVFQDKTEAFIHLLLPQEVAGKANAFRGARSQDHRALVGTEEWEDRNDGGNPRPIETQRLNVQVAAYPTLETPKGFESIPVMKLMRGKSAEAAPEIDLNYIPPLLACDCWKVLREDILVAVASQLGNYTKTQADYLKTHGGWTEANQPQIRKAIMLLHSVNCSFPFLSQLTEARGVHPFQAYTELCRLVGQLAIFREDWTPPDLPRYDHDDLGRIFRTIKIELDRVLTIGDSEPKVRRYPFRGMEEWMEVALEPAWFRGKHTFHVGVRSDLSESRPDLVEKLFSPKWLNWKLGSNRTINQIFRAGEAGLSLARVVGIHPKLPALRDYTYFTIDAHGPYWDQVVESRILALKLSKEHVKGEFFDKDTLTVLDPKNVARDLKLELFVVEND